VRRVDAGSAFCFAFSPSGKMLATGGADGTILLWDISAIRPTETVPDTAPELLWADLAGDAIKAYRAVVALGDQGERAVKFLAERLKPAAPIEPKRIDQWLADLDSPQFAVRNNARAELAALAERAEPALRARLKATTSAEARLVIKRLVDALDSGWVTHPSRLREVRAVEALERNRSPAARRLLQDLAKGDPAARLTVEAQAGLRWKDRNSESEK
jgi:hypothetical protein